MVFALRTEGERNPESKPRRPWRIWLVLSISLAVISLSGCNVDRQEFPPFRGINVASTVVRLPDGVGGICADFSDRNYGRLICVLWGEKGFAEELINRGFFAAEQQIGPYSVGVLGVEGMR